MPRKIDKIQHAFPDEGKAYQECYVYDKTVEKYTRFVLYKYGVTIEKA